MAQKVMAEKVVVFDTTLRDGEQSPGCSMTFDEKVEMARQLDRLGVDVIETGFPVASPGDFDAVREIARRVRRPRITALARARREDIARAWEAIEGAARPRLHTFLATSDVHLQHKLRCSRSAALERAGEAVRFARSLCDDVEFSPEDATRSDVDFLREILGVVIEAGATTLNIPDTVGYAVPREFGGLIEHLRVAVGGIDSVTISVHCHNDLGLAVANSLAAIEAGARQVECTINGIGERAGNAALEEVVMALRTRREALPYETGVRTEELYPTSHKLAEIIGIEPQPNKAIVGRNAFAHEAGIHQHGVLSNPLCYEIMTPESVGVSGNRLVLGKHSGRHALAHRYAELGYALGERELAEVYERFGRLADRKKRLYDLDLLSLLPRAGLLGGEERGRHGSSPRVGAAVQLAAGAGGVRRAASA